MWVGKVKGDGLLFWRLLMAQMEHALVTLLIVCSSLPENKDV
jgi:hypothetical protein